MTSTSFNIPYTVNARYTSILPSTPKKQSLFLYDAPPVLMSLGVCILFALIPPFEMITGTESLE